MTVLIVTAVGLLFGAGALLLFRFQCQQRIDRQHELEKIYAVRSAMNFARTYTSLFPTNGISFKYCARSGRNLDVLVKPVEYIFPDVNFSSNGVRHLVMEGFLDKKRYIGTDANGQSRVLAVSSSIPNQYRADLDYEYGMMTNVFLSEDEAAVKPNLRKTDKLDNSFIENHVKGNEPGDKQYGIDFPNSATNHVKWWVNVGMPGKGGWLHEEYGRRYYFNIGALVGEAESGMNTACSSDVLNFCIIQNKYHPDNPPGCRHGWPLSDNEKALVLRIRRFDGQVSLDFYEYVYGEKPRFKGHRSMTELHYDMGMQIAQKKVSLFWQVGSSSGGSGQMPIDLEDGGIEISDDIYTYFMQPCEIAPDGRVRKSPDLRAVFEIVACSEVRNEGSFEPVVSEDGSTQVPSREDFISNFRVTPAYQYDIFLKCPNVQYADEKGDLATVAQLIPKTDKSIGFPIITYDTHGTEHKGFRYDERHPNGK